MTPEREAEIRQHMNADYDYGDAEMLSGEGQELLAEIDRLRESQADALKFLQVDHEEYLDALATAFGEDMGDGAETTLSCEIDRLKRLAEQGVIVRHFLGKESWDYPERTADLLDAMRARVKKLEEAHGSAAKAVKAASEACGKLLAVERDNKELLEALLIVAAQIVVADVRMDIGPTYRLRHEGQHKAAKAVKDVLERILTAVDRHATQPVTAVAEQPK